jgi:hypothetical protein
MDCSNRRSAGSLFIRDLPARPSRNRPRDVRAVLGNYSAYLCASIQADLKQSSEAPPFVPLTTNDKAEKTVDSHPTPAKPYTSLLKYFAVRFCVAVTLAVILMGTVEFYSYKRYLPVGDPLEPAVKLDMAATGSAAEREYWNEFIQANKVGYHQYVLWRRLLLIRANFWPSIRTECGGLCTHAAMTMPRLLPSGCSAIRSCGERDRPTPTPSRP